MSASRTNPGTPGASNRPARNEGWINEFERVYLLGAAKTCGGLPLWGGTLSETTRLEVASGAALAGGRLIAIACLVAWSLGLADGWAENATTGVAGATASEGVTCNRSVRNDANSVFRPGSRGGESVTIDGKGSAEIGIWKTITLGTYDSAESLRGAVRCYAGQRARAALAAPAFAVSTSKREVDLAVLPLTALAFDAEGASVAAVHARAAQLGLELCPVEVAAQLRLQYLDQPIGEFLHIAMEPVATSDGELVTLTVANGGAGLTLIGGHAPPDFIMPSAARFVFVRPR
jgi:hypothetical protein